MPKNEYLIRHDKVCAHLHFSIHKAKALKQQRVHTHAQASVGTGNVTVVWNQAAHMDREVTANRPDIIIKNKKRKHAYWLIDAAIHTDRNVMQKGSGKDAKIQEFMYRETTNVKPEM